MAVAILFVVSKKALGRGGSNVIILDYSECSAPQLGRVLVIWIGMVTQSKGQGYSVYSYSGIRLIECTLITNHTRYNGNHGSCD